MLLPLRLVVAATVVAAASAAHAAFRLRVEYLERPITVDVINPRFSWALQHSNRAEVQTNYNIVVKRAHDGSVVWDATVASNQSLNQPYAGDALTSNTDYTWTVTWQDSTGALSTPASSTFSTALLSPADWRGAAWLSSPNNGSLNTYRAEFTLPAVPVRARLFISGLGYHKTWINGALVDAHELGQFVTFEQRVLYDVVDVAPLLVAGCNALGIMLGRGWFSQSSVHSGDRQLRFLLSVTAADGTPSYFASALVAGDGALALTATAGPVLDDDIYKGEVYDGGLAAALAGWAACGFAPAPGAWVPAVAPATSPATFGSLINAHTVQVTTDTSYAVAAITEPLPGVFVLDFGQNVAGQTELFVQDCPPGTNITLQHAEILHPDGTINNNYLPEAPMTGVYICGGGDEERYRTLFSYYGFRYVQVTGWPGVPGEGALTSHFVHSDFPQAGEFTSSDGVLNAIQHATRYASWSNLVDVPTDCPQRERRGWLGDAQLSFETVIHNIDGGAFYTKWLRDFIDTQVYDNATMGTDGALPDCIPFYGHGHKSADAGWGIAAWTITDWFSDYYADDVFDAAWYPNLKWYAENWVAIAEANGGLFNLFFWGDWANYIPGPYAFKTPEYPLFFYITALDITAKFATRLGHADDAARYSGLSAASRALYVKTYYNATTHCFANCTYVSQLFGLALDLVPADDDAVWAHCMDWFGPNASVPHSLPNHFGGGIISLKYLYPQLTKRGLTGLGLRMHLQSDQPPGFGYWIANNATTLWEAYDMTSTVGGASRNHIMFGASGSWYYSNLAGLGRAPASRSWQRLAIAPPGDADTLSQLSSAAASIDSPMGPVAVSWATQAAGPYEGDQCKAQGENTNMTFTCAGADGKPGPGKFTDVVFASFGTPAGSCSAGWAVDANCSAPTSAAVVSAACVGRTQCTIAVTNGNFGGDPCFKVVKNLAVVLKGDCYAPLMTLATTVPVGGTASVTVPTPGASPATVIISEGGTTVWSNGAFVPGVAGVSSAAASPAGVAFEVGSGSYEFVAVSTA